MTDPTEMVERFRAALMSDYADEWTMEQIADAAYTCAWSVQRWLAEVSPQEIEAAAIAACNARPHSVRKEDVPCSFCTKYAKAALVASRSVLLGSPHTTQPMPDPYTLP